jgi:hypothetical protein
VAGFHVSAVIAMISFAARGGLSNSIALRTISLLSLFLKFGELKILNISYLKIAKQNVPCFL